MTLGEKIKEARKEAGLSQEQLAEKMSVSRSAIAKWETDKGIPDVNNLKVMSQLLGVSIDYLLDDGEKISFNEIKEPINLEDFEKTGKCRDKKDAACLAKHKDASAIYASLIFSFNPELLMRWTGLRNLPDSILWKKEADSIS